MDGVNRGFSKYFGCSFVVWLAISCSAQKLAAGTKTALPDCDPMTGQVLRCPQLGFFYRVPFGWVDRTKEMQQSATEDPAPSETAADPKRNDPTGKTLLAVFERPPGIPGDEINSAVIIAVEDRAAYAQVKTAADYFGPLADVAEGRGVKLQGTPYSFDSGTRQVVRGDFAGGDEKMPIRQTSLVSLEKGYILSFTFLASSDDEIDSLLQNLTFRSTSKKARK